MPFHIPWYRSNSIPPCLTPRPPIGIYRPPRRPFTARLLSRTRQMFFSQSDPTLLCCHDPPPHILRPPPESFSSLVVGHSPGHGYLGLQATIPTLFIYQYDHPGFEANRLVYLSWSSITTLRYSSLRQTLTLELKSLCPEWSQAPFLFQAGSLTIRLPSGCSFLQECTILGYIRRVSSHLFASVYVPNGLSFFIVRQIWHKTADTDDDCDDEPNYSYTPTVESFARANPRRDNETDCKFDATILERMSNLGGTLSRGASVVGQAVCSKFGKPN